MSLLHSGRLAIAAHDLSRSKHDPQARQLNGILQTLPPNALTCVMSVESQYGHCRAWSATT